MKNLNQFKAFEISVTNEVKGGSIGTKKEECVDGTTTYTDRWYLFKKNNESLNVPGNPHKDYTGASGC